MVDIFWYCRPSHFADRQCEYLVLASDLLMKFLTNGTQKAWVIDPIRL